MRAAHRLPTAPRRFFISHAFGNSFVQLVEDLEAHFRAAGAIFERVFVWLDGARLPRCLNSRRNGPAC